MIVATTAALVAMASPVTVEVGNGASTVVRDGSVDYTITVRNDSDVAYSDVLIAQLLPQALTFERSDVEPSMVRTGEVQWRQALAAHGQIVLHVRGKVGEASAQWPKLTTTSCVRVDAQSSLVCASDSDPFGVPEKPDRRWWWLGAAGLGMAILAIFKIYRTRGLAARPGWRRIITGRGND